MSDQPKRPDGARLLYDLQHSDELQQQRVAGVALDAQLTLLRKWQSQRLARPTPTCSPAHTPVQPAAFS
jgi:hypothetical protein